ncbi:hypothetical protein [Paraconexibacter algicola]|uniref:CcmD family protein n=1 Tax=Paraconexibacter algicola TaxID=2133960 RepID=A0A2T4UMZ2_9ACTN|nr:hypothetical protein [Paraconexibacter algicola]PTL60606.1 hypothetical protein C7Y72_13645 [Paraconexibacter algicola]
MTAFARIALTTCVTFALLAPSAFAQASGEGLYGETNDRVVTKAGFILIAFFPLFILTMSLIQWKLEKRKDEKKAAAKSRANDEIWKGGW